MFHTQLAHSAFGRRSFLMSSVAAGAAAVALPRVTFGETRGANLGANLGVGAAMADTNFAWAEVDGSGARKGAMIGSGDGGNSLLFIKGKAAVLIDTKNAPLGGLVSADAAALGFDVSGKGEALVINTHHHADHTGGNHGFVGKVPVLAHKKAQERVQKQIESYQRGATAAIRQAKGATDEAGKKRAAAIGGLEGAISGWTGATFAPTQVLEADRQEVNVGGIALILRHFGSGHTDNDVVVYDPALNVLHTGDLLFHKVWPYFDIPSGANSSGWVNSLTRTLEMCDKDTIIVPGHGAVTDRGAIRALIELFLSQSQRARDAVKKGQSREEFIKVATPEYADYAAADWIRPITLGGLYDEAKALKA
jgi:cyclase